LKKIFPFESPREQYHCDAAVVWCFDFRFDPVFRNFLPEIGVRKFDSIQIAGGAKSLAVPGNERDRDFVVEQIRKSIRLRGTGRVILTLHSDCGAYGGLAATFGGDARAEAEQRERELRRAATSLIDAIPALRVDAYYADFEGVWEVELPRPL